MRVRLEAVDVCFARDDGVDVLAGINLGISDTEVVALVGKSGVGKSTLIRLLAGLEAPTRGRVTVRDHHDEVVSDAAACRSQSGLNAHGYVPQDYGLLPWLTAEQNTEVALVRLKLPKRERRQRCADALALVGAANFAQLPVCSLSGGMRQRVAVARAIVGDSSVLLLDEPFSGLDWWTRRELQANLLEMQRARGIGLLFVTHDIDEALFLADRVVVLGGAPGRIVQVVAVPLPRSEREDAEHAQVLSQLRATVLSAVSGSHTE